MRQVELLRHILRRAERGGVVGFYVMSGFLWFLVQLLVEFYLYRDFHSACFSSYPQIRKKTRSLKFLKAKRTHYSSC